MAKWPDWIDLIFFFFRQEDRTWRDPIKLKNTKTEKHRNMVRTGIDQTMQSSSRHVLSIREMLEKKKKN
jgi:hypothetical protein